jgi:hypothetical protein
MLGLGRAGRNPNGTPTRSRTDAVPVPANDHNEAVVGLEILLGNLHEVGFTLSPELHDELSWPADRLQLDGRYILILDSLKS